MRLKLIACKIFSRELSYLCSLSDNIVDITWIRQGKHNYPEAHDCITLFMGSKERYTKYFNEIPGCYWYTADWIENADMPRPDREARMVKMYEEQGYDEDTIEYLLEALNGLANYHNAAYIKMPFYDKECYRDFTKQAADHFGWKYHEIEGDMSLMERFINGDWNEEDFIVLEPGEAAVQSYDQDILRKGIPQGK